MPYESGRTGHQTVTTRRAANYNGDDVMAQIPLLGAWSGARGRQQAEQDAQAAEQNRAYWNELNPPGVDDLREGPGRDAELSALDQMSEWGSGGLTSADRGMLDASRRRDEQAASAQRQAIARDANARGVGGGGLDFAMQQQADQRGQQQSSDREAQLMSSAQDRALQAIQQQGQMGSQLRQQDSGDVQGSFDNATTIAAGATNQYAGDAQTRQQGRDRQQDSDDSLLGFLGSL
jgi:hypothetical protein